MAITQTDDTIKTGTVTIGQILKALSASGLLIQDDGGNTALKVVDGGNTVIVGSDTYVEPYTGYDAQGNVVVIVRYPTAHSTATPIVGFVFANNQTNGASGNVATLNFINEAIAAADKRIAQIVVQTDAAIDEGKIILRTLDGGVSKDVLTLLANGNVGIGVPVPLRILDIGTGVAKATAVTTEVIGIRSNDASNRLELTFGLIGHGTSGSRAAAIQSVEQGVAVRSLLLNPSGGNVGIGSTLIPAVPLRVAGTIHAIDTGASATPTISIAGDVAVGNLTAYGSSFSGAGLGGKIAFGATVSDFIIYTDGSVASGGTNSIQFRVGGYEVSQERMRLTTVGLALGLTVPQGQLHAHDGLSGKLFTSKSLVGSVPVVIIPNGTGDVTKYIMGRYMGIQGASVVVGNIICPNNASMTGVVIGTGTWTFTVALNGQFSVSRTAGSGNADFTLDLNWQ